jgi:hypothetical protein
MKLIQGKAANLHSERVNLPASEPTMKKRISGNAQSLALGLAALLLTAPAAQAQFGTQPVGVLSGAQTFPSAPAVRPARSR